MNGCRLRAHVELEDAGYETTVLESNLGAVSWRRLAMSGEICSGVRGGSFCFSLRHSYVAGYHGSWWLCPVLPGYSDLPRPVHPIHSDLLD